MSLSLRPGYRPLLEEAEHFFDRTNSVFAVHALAPNHQLLHYEQSQLFPKMRTFKLPREALSNPEQEVTTRSDLESVGLVICSNEVRLPLCPLASHMSHPTFDTSPA